jgi:hypothetical protein
MLDVQIWLEKSRLKAINNNYFYPVTVLTGTVAY